MILSVDIDGVLCRQNNRAYMRACNQVLKLGIAEDDLARLAYRDFLTCPALAAYRDLHGDQTTDKALAWMYYHPLSLKAAKVLTGALEGVTELAQHAREVYYYTARYSESEWWNGKMQRATRIWLETYAFPASGNVRFCQGYRDKAEQLQRLSESGPVLHIDDSWEKLASHLPTTPSLRLVAFGVHLSHVPTILALPDWQHIQPLIDYLLERRSIR